MEELPELLDAPLKEAPEIEAVVAGFSAHAVACGLRADGREDLALIAAAKPVPAAGVFTRSLLKAAPVLVSQEHIASGKVRAVLANSGGANAATGQPGMDACRLTCKAASQALGCPPQEIIPCSTGVIGQVLDADKVEAAMTSLAAGLSPNGLPLAALAIRTTDAFTKMARCDAEINGRPVRVVGMAKGAGMIRPDMATMLAFVFTDAAATPQALKHMVKVASDLSFNRITVDGETSTNDTLLLMASGKAGGPALESGDQQIGELSRAVTKVCQDLATMIAADGEGAGHLVRVRITGAPDEDSARHLCYAIAHSPLCKTAFAGRDPNWGRLLSAPAAEAARRGLTFVPEKTRLWIGESLVAEKALWTGLEAEEAAAQTMKKNRYEIRLDLGLGQASYWVLTTDLDHEYIKINAEYRS